MKAQLRRSLSHDSRMSAVALPTYGPATGVRTKPGLVFARGKGIKLWDTAGKEYLDFSAGIAVNVLGHCDEELSKAIADQTKKLAHVSNLYHTEENLKLHEKLIQVSPGFEKVFLCNSGTEANEAALKFAALRAFCKDDDRSRIIAFKSSFHGRTLGSLSVTYKPAIRAPFKSIIHQNVDFCEFNNLKQVKEKMEKDVLAVIVEPVQGEGGVNPAQPEFLEGLRSICDSYGSTLIFDEIQIGLGRSGHMWGHHAYKVKPDIMTAAKPLAGGLPIGATFVSHAFYQDVPESKWTGAHGTTFGGNPFVAKAATVVLDRVSNPDFMSSVRKSGSKLIKGLLDIQSRHPNKIKQVRRPLGDSALYAGVLLSAPVASKVVMAGLDKGVVFITAGDYGDTLRICPPLIATEEDVAVALKVLESAIQETEWPATSPTSTTTSSPQLFSKIARRVGDKVTTFNSVEAHRKFIEQSCPLPPGFRVGADKLSFVPKELGPGAKSFPMRLSLISLEAGKATTQYAAVFTKNAFPGAPIRVGRELVQSGAPIGGILVNNKVSNVHPHGGGVNDAKTLCEAASKALNLVSGAQILPASTGVIGWSLPVKEMIECIPRVVKNTSASSSALVPAEAIMTTDRYPKARSDVVKLSNGKQGRITGVAKGAGMIEPNMATMLVYIMTDVSLPRPVLQKALQNAVNRPGSFNRITVDSDQSTSDMVILLSSAKVDASTDQDVENFSEALARVCSDLAEDIVRNGEGTKHVIRIAVTGAPTDALAHGVGAAVANSPLVKTAIFGNDPNVGRVVAAVGSYLGKQKSLYVAKTLASKTVVRVGGTVVFENGEFALDSEKERVLNRMMRDAEMDYSKGDFPPHDRVVDIHIALNGGDCETVVIGSDLSPEYVEVNGNYRS